MGFLQTGEAECIAVPVQLLWSPRFSFGCSLENPVWCLHSTVMGRMWGCPLASSFCQERFCLLTAAPQVVLGCSLTLYPWEAAH